MIALIWKLLGYFVYLVYSSYNYQLAMKSQEKKLKIVFTSPVFVVFTMSICILLVNLIHVHLSRPYNSDDVSWQSTLLTWRPYTGSHAYLAGSDTFILKAPIFLLFNHFFEPSRRLLFAESAFFAVITFTLYYFSSLYFLGKMKIKLSYQNLLPFIWFASFGFAIGELYLNPILRNFEIGLAFFYFVMAAKVYYREIDLSLYRIRFYGIIAGIIAGALVYNDPYFLFFTLAPIAFLYAILWFRHKIDFRQMSFVAAVTVIGLVASKMVALAVSSSGVAPLFSLPVQFVAYDKFFSNVALTIHSVLYLFGADFFGKVVLAPITFIALLNLAILIVILFSFYSQVSISVVRTKPSWQSYKLWGTFFACVSAFSLVTHAFSTLAVDIQTYRYLIIFAFSGVLVLSFFVGKMQKGKLLLTAIICLSILGNIASLFTSQQSKQSGAIDNIKNNSNFSLIATVNHLNLSKGYAPYWDGNINTYLSKGSVHFLPIICSADRTIFMNYLVDASQYKTPVARSFYLVDSDLKFPPTCSDTAILKQFGDPAKVVKVGNITILIYDYDLGKRM